MRWNDLFIDGVATALGHEERTADAVADGRYDAEEHERSGYLGVRVCPEGPAIELAVRAAERALKRSGTDPDRFTLVTHSSVAHQGLDDFAPAAHLQSRTVGGRGTAVEIRQASNGGMAALELAAAHLSVGRPDGAVLLATSDRFVPPGYDRFRTAQGCLLGDGGTSLVLARGSGALRLCSSASMGDTAHEGLQIGADPWSEVSGGNGWPVDQDQRVRGYVERHGPEIFMDLVQSIWACENETMERALADADCTARDIAHWVFPNMGLALTGWDSRAEFGVDLERTTWEWGRRAGHLGAGDQFAGLAHLLESGALSPGDRVLLHGAGTGFSFTSAVVEVLEIPDRS
ncbi:3-oxoacyl-[acyl-carrier-protein] synthase 3 protein 5 [Streptomyces inusitatus]|uniref:3-oxoacyl-[acyl-carrier-protein] synthase 3 protein 5 n=1 Tax=Streptomyces inusitatus TaxID=68221 RepID=A0A918QJ25_9ACTN|nr:ketoacyl-ACP synthase III family protein [Streptomyces inusitatus]GGZ48807.1 3-oxoacyl-[acyl-carrier-protein] synthase 3 protein 5 [Streptomyces inusitatus]